MDVGCTIKVFNLSLLNVGYESVTYKPTVKQLQLKFTL